MEVGACVGAGDARGGGGTFCLQVWESVVSAGGRERVGAGEALLFPSAGKQCPRRVFYGSCWTLISFVARLSSAAAALSPQKRAPPPPPPRKATHHAFTALLEVHNGLHSIPCGKACNKSINDRPVNVQFFFFKKAVN